MNKRQTFTLFAILATSSLASLVLGYEIVYDRTSGLFMNLASELFGILVTIFYVDKLIKTHEENQWASTRKKIEIRIRNIVVDCLFSILSIFQLSDRAQHHLVAPKSKEKGDTYSVRFDIDEAFFSDVIKVSKHIFNIRLDAKEISIVRDWLEEITNIIDIFGQKLDPSLFDGLIGIQEDLRRILAYPSLYKLLDTKQREETTQIKDAKTRALVFSATSLSSTVNNLAKLQQLLAEKA